MLTGKRNIDIYNVSNKKRGNEMRIEYVKDGINKVAICDNYEEIEEFIDENNLTESREPENEGEYRITE